MLQNRRLYTAGERSEINNVKIRLLSLHPMHHSFSVYVCCYTGYKNELCLAQKLDITIEWNASNELSLAKIAAEINSVGMAQLSDRQKLFSRQLAQRKGSQPAAPKTKEWKTVSNLELIRSLQFPDHVCWPAELHDKHIWLWHQSRIEPLPLENSKLCCACDSATFLWYRAIPRLFAHPMLKYILERVRALYSLDYWKRKKIIKDRNLARLCF